MLYLEHLSVVERDDDDPRHRDSPLRAVCRFQDHAADVGMLLRPRPWKRIFVC